MFGSIQNDLLCILLNHLLLSLPRRRNMGAYSYISPRLMTATRELNKNEKRARYVGRMVSSAPATGMSKIHKKEYNDILEGVFGKVA